MAILPQISVTEFDTWRKKADQRISFLVLFSNKRSTGERLPAAKALTHAAELAFATSQVPRGCELMEQALDILLKDLPTAFTRISILGALTKQVDTSLRASGIIINGAVPGPWRGSASTLRRVAGTLIAAAACSPSLITALDLLFQDIGKIKEPNSRLAFLALVSALEADTLPIFGFGRRDDGSLDPNGTREGRSAALSAFSALHLRYAARLRLLASDQAHWHDLRTRAPLIDWALLGLHVAAIRRHTTIDQNLLKLLPGVGPTLNFIGSLASDIVQRYGPPQSQSYPQ
jgi:hypothetical protein